MICDVSMNEHSYQKNCDIVFFLGEKLPEDLEERLDQLDKEVHDDN